MLNFKIEVPPDRCHEQGGVGKLCPIGDTCHQIPPNIDGKWIVGNEAVIGRLIMEAVKTITVKIF